MAYTVLLTVGCLAAVATTGLAQINQTCITPSRQTGRCVLPRDCEPLQAILRDQPSSEVTVQFPCNFKGRPLMVCCSTTPPHANPQNSSVQGHPTTATTRPEPPTSRSPPGLGAVATLNTSTTPYSVGNHPNRALLNADRCGIDHSTAIYRGNITSIEEYPWSALLQYRNADGNTRFLCGGVLISQRYVLTAAHCTNSTDLRGNTLVGVRLGEYNTATDQDCEGDFAEERVCSGPHRDYTIQQVVAHPEYRSSSRVHDIALLRLDGEAPYSASIEPICIPLEDEVRSMQYVDRVLGVVGWGHSQTRSGSSVKMRAVLKVIGNANCQTIYSRWNLTITANQLCAVVRDGRQVPCALDSGGALTSMIPRAGRMYVAGIESYGPEHCGSEGPPVVFTRISQYVGWILDHMRP